MQNPQEIVQAALRSSLERIIATDSISTVFQPIRDIRDGDLFGYEALSRGAFPFSSPSLMFEVAERCGLSLDLDRECRVAALRNIAALPPAKRAKTFFINVSRRSITDGRAVEGLTLSRSLSTSAFATGRGSTSERLNPWRLARPAPASKSRFCRGLLCTLPPRARHSPSCAAHRESGKIDR
jgi:predicted signal transduction protein with EAL and GGDEF domain